ncbi:MAG: class I SAM-dependent methyltransferase [Halobacteria archaeon]|nr:class I SAM-dependent methyltransferase [Halobacteria archaeon]
MQGHPVLASIYDGFVYPAERLFYREYREWLAENLDGRVLEIGVGTGAMLPYYPPDIDLHAVEPDSYMRRQATKKARKLDVDIQVLDARAEYLPYRDDSFDAVVASLVFCTIPDVEKALSEVHRVLESDGEFRFLEHVRSDGIQGRVQDLLAPAWYRVAGGCHLNRRTDTTIEETGTFELVESKKLGILVPPVKPHVRGRAVPIKSRN